MYVFVKICFYGDQPLNMALAKTPGWLVVQPNAWMDRRVDVHLLLIKQLIFKAHLLSKQTADLENHSTPIFFHLLLSLYDSSP